MVNKISKILVLVFVLGLISLIVDSYFVKYDVEDKGKISIGKYVSRDNWAKGELNYFIFYIDGKRYREDGGRAPLGFSENLGKFYRIKYSEKYKGAIKALFNQEVTDTTEILKAGFTKEELNNIYNK